MYHKHHTKGIIIGGRAEGDHNRIIQIFTEQFGLITAKIQGARTLQSKLRAGSQDFSIGEFSLVHGKAGWKLVSTRSEGNIFERFRTDNLKLHVSMNLLSLIKKLVGEEESHTQLFSSITSFFDTLEKTDVHLVPALECIVLLKTLHYLGYMRHDPEFSVSLTSASIETEEVTSMLPKRARMVELINEALKATQIVT